MKTLEDADLERVESAYVGKTRSVAALEQLRNDRALFIPLKAEFFDAFASGDKTTEYRMFGKRWNHKTCWRGRRVILSRGYGKAHRLTGLIRCVYTTASTKYIKGFVECYGSRPGDIALCIGIDVDVDDIK